MLRRTAPTAPDKAVPPTKPVERPDIEPVTVKYPMHRRRLSIAPADVARLAESVLLGLLGAEPLAEPIQLQGQFGSLSEALPRTRKAPRLPDGVRPECGRERRA